TPNTSKDRESRAASAGPLINPNANGNIETTPTSSTTRTTGAIPKIKSLNLGSKQNSNTSQQNSNTTTTEKTTVTSLKNALTKKSSASSSSSSNTSATTAALSAGQTQKTQTSVSKSSSSQNSTMAEQNNSTLNRISKSSLQWLLVNKWLPLWMGQGTDCKVIDFNFMFSRDCVDCDAASAAAQMANPYGTPRLTGLPQDIVRFNARAEMHAAATTYSRRQNDLNTSRPMHNTLNRLREAEPSPYARRYEDPSYENVHVQWQNGFEFGRSRDYDHSIAASAATGPYQSPAAQRAPLQRARSESPTLNQRSNAYASRRLRAVNNNLTTNQTVNINPSSSSNASNNNNSVKFKESYRNFEKSSDNSNIKPNLMKAETLDVVESVATLALPKLAVSTTNESSPLEDLEGAVGGLVEMKTTNEPTPSTSSSSVASSNDMNNLDMATLSPVAQPSIELPDNDNNLPILINNLDIKSTSTMNSEQKDN
ncbi:Ring canal kelch protein, partial [Lucilia cuprina]